MRERSSEAKIMMKQNSSDCKSDTIGIYTTGLVRRSETAQSNNSVMVIQTAANLLQIRMHAAAACCGGAVLHCITFLLKKWAIHGLFFFIFIAPHLSATPAHVKRT